MFNIRKYSSVFSYSILLITSLLLIPTILFAQSTNDNLIITLLVDNDTVAPTVPANLTAVAMSSSEIELTWDASTDAYGVIGYNIFRDNILVATTNHPIVTYLDAGLSESTSYAYNVTAFDSAPNESAKSSTSSAQTLASGGGGGGGGGSGTPLPIISNIAVVLSTGDALITWETNRLSVGTVSWGRTPDLELGSISESGHTLSHAIFITDLNSETLYYYKIEVTDRYNQTVRMPTDTFITDLLPDTTPPANVSDFNIVEEEAVLHLNWSNPPDADFSHVRVVRSDSFFPLTPTDGIVVYEGPLETVIDNDVATGITYYYTNFAVDTNGNFSSGAVVSDSVISPTDTTPPANVSDFNIVEEEAALRLNWSNPSDADFSTVRIVRSQISFPALVTGGIIIYEGSGETILDSNISTDVTYYYTNFSLDASGNYAEGAVALGFISGEVSSPASPRPPTFSPVGGGGQDIVTIEEPEVKEPPPTPTPPIVELEPDPFSRLPIAVTTDNPQIIEQIERIKFSDFEIIQNGDKQKFTNEGKIFIDANEPFTISIDYEKTPEVLKTIGAVLRHPVDKNKMFSFLLGVNEDKSAYMATIAPLNKTGNYETTLYILNHDNQRIKKVHGNYIARGEELAIEIPIEAISRVAGITGVLIGVTQVIVLTSNASALSGTWLLILRLFTLLTGPFRRKRSEPWGVVYDSVTKRPIDPAYVIIEQKGQEKGEAITGLDGRYGFLMQPGQYSLTVAKSHYEFPSKKLSGKQKDELYDNLYFGQKIEINDTKVTNYNIPLDPIEFDWNEFAKQRQHLYILHSRKERMKSIIFNTIFFFGFAFSGYIAWIVPSITNYLILWSYVVILFFQSFWRVTHKVTRVVNKETGIPSSFAIVRAYMSLSKTPSKKVVTDQFGKFFMLIPKGKYFFTIEEKQSDGSYSLVHTTPPMNLKRGIVTEDIII